MTVKTIFPAAVLLLLVSGIASAHHAAAGIDRSKTVTVEGVVKSFKWANPHSWIEMEVTKDGRTELWNFEMLPPSYLIQAGWTKNSVKPGDRVTVVANGFMDGSPGGVFVSVTLDGGQTLGQRGGGRGGAAGARGGAGPRGQ